MLDRSLLLGLVYLAEVFGAVANDVYGPAGRSTTATPGLRAGESCPRERL